MRARMADDVPEKKQRNERCDAERDQEEKPRIIAYRDGERHASNLAEDILKIGRQSQFAKQHLG